MLFRSGQSSKPRMERKRISIEEKEGLRQATRAQPEGDSHFRKGAKQSQGSVQGSERSQKVKEPLQELRKANRRALSRSDRFPGSSLASQTKCCLVLYFSGVPSQQSKCAPVQPF